MFAVMSLIFFSVFGGAVRLGSVRVGLEGAGGGQGEERPLSVYDDDDDKGCSFFAKRRLSCARMKSAEAHLHGLHSVNPSFALRHFVRGCGWRSVGQGG